MSMLWYPSLLPSCPLTPWQELGNVFDVTSNTAQLQALLFFAMTYAPGPSSPPPPSHGVTGIPLLMPFCAFVFFIYFNVDKLLLLRHYHKPPKMGDAVMRVRLPPSPLTLNLPQVVLDFLPWAAVLRLVIACWMLSNYQLFPDSKLLISKTATPLSRSTLTLPLL
jgi:hypothetical protein